MQIPPFSKEQLFNELKGECDDFDRLLEAIRFGDGTVGKAKSLYFDEQFSITIDFAKDMLCDMKSSSNVLEYSIKAQKLKCEVEDLLDVLEFLLRDMLLASEGKSELISNESAYNVTKNAVGFNTGAIIHALDKITEARKRKKFNANPQMLIEWLMLQILEGKFKWQKL